MSEFCNDKSNTLIPLNFALNKLSKQDFTCDNMRILAYLKNPIQSYIETIHKRFKDPHVCSRIICFLQRDYDKVEDLGLDFSKIIDNILLKIKNNLKISKSFPTLSVRDIKYLLKYRELWLDSSRTLFKHKFIDYLQNLENISSGIYKSLLYIYLKEHTFLRDNLDFYNIFTILHKKYIERVKFIPKSVEAILSDTDILKNTIEKDLAEACLNEKINNPDTNILFIISKRYKFILPGMDIYDELIKEIGLLCFKKKNESNNFYLQILLEEILNADIKPSESAELVTEIIQMYRNTNTVSVVIQDKIRTALLKSSKYGDPRINPTNWILVEPEAKKIFTQWLAQEDLEFFFDIMFKHSPDPHKRKLFWEQYINSDELTGSKVILSPEAASLSVVKDLEKKGRRFAKFKSSIDNASCFILEFNQLSIVEFSEKNNALFFYDTGYLPIKLDELYYDNVSELKKSYIKLYSLKNEYEIPSIKKIKYFKIAHQDNWKVYLKKYLNKFGIYPGDS